MKKFTFSLYQGESPPNRDYHAWIPSWWVQADGIPVATGELPGGVRWLLAGWFLNDRNVSDVIQRFVTTRDMEYLFSVDGQFVLAIHSENQGSVEVHRDRTGTFPLVYAHHLHGVAISVDTGDLQKTCSIPLSPSSGAFSQWPVFRKTSAPYTAFEGMIGLAPEDSLSVVGRSFATHPHPFCRSGGREFPNLRVASEQLGAELSRAVRRRVDPSKRMGVLLSGGNDSSLVVALVRESYAGRLKTLFLGFEDYTRDYGRYAQYVADRFATDHTAVRLSPKDFAGCWAETVAVLQTPVSMPGQVALHHGLKLLSGHVDLMIDADGADTIFGSSLWPQMIFLSRIRRQVPRLFTGMLERLSRMMPAEASLRKILAKSVTALTTPLAAYPHVNAAMISRGDFEGVFQQGKWEDAIAFRQGLARGEFYSGFFSYLMLHGLPGDLATAVRLGLSQRILFAYPFLDYAFLVASLRLPNRLRYHYRIRKAPLKRFSERYFDKQFIHKPKEGFGVPLSKWFTRKEFAPFLRLPLETRSLRRGWWKEQELRRVIDLHREGKGTDRTAEAVPWVVSNMELWARICLEGDSPSLYQ